MKLTNASSCSIAVANRLDVHKLIHTHLPGVGLKLANVSSCSIAVAYRPNVSFAIEAISFADWASLGFAAARSKDRLCACGVCNS